jgi:hypothetical protein
MTDTTLAHSAPAGAIRPRYAVMTLAALAVLIVAVASPSTWLLQWVHIMSGTLWTGIDLFMGFIIGPVMRMLPLEARRPIMAALVPRMLFLMPTLSILTGTAGWYLAKRTGYLDVGYPEFYWVAAALSILAVLTVQGLAILLPTNFKVYREMQKPQPDFARVGYLMKWYVRVVAIQGVMQVAMIVIMARFGSGL